MAETPFDFVLDAAALGTQSGVCHVVRHLSDVGPSFADQEAVRQVLAHHDPVVYEGWEVSNEASAWGLSFSLVRILPGMVGQEYYMTKGHFHTVDEDGDELYLPVQGQGLLVLQSREGQSHVLTLASGRICFVPAGWGHRSVNCGDVDLEFLCVWPCKVGHDYAAIAQGGFPQLVMSGDQGPVFIQNPFFVNYADVMRQRS